MRESNRKSAERKSNIQCIEVLISRSCVRDSDRNLIWTLSVYSLENHPVKMNRSLHNSEIFHFMLYDWQRTIKAMLEGQQVPYSIVQYFSPESIHTGMSYGSIASPDSEEKFLSAINDLSEIPRPSVRVATSSHEFMVEDKLP